jgi:phosphatidylethanolamine/phosphatidyl-N-methylethanolamine N-methyltransferase
MSRTSAAERAAVDSRRVRRVYAVLARVYDGAFDWALGPGRRQAVAELPLAAGERVLEVGVGTGLSLPYYPEGCHVTGIDISEAMLEQAHERVESLGEGRFDLRLMDAHQLGYPDGTFDHVLAPYVISVVPEPHKVMQEIARVCRPGGTVVVVNHFRGSNAIRRSGERLLTPASQWIGFRMDVPVETATETAGLELVRSERVNLLGLWQLLVLRRTGQPKGD